MSIYDPRDTFKVASNPISAASSIRPISKADIPPSLSEGGYLLLAEAAVKNCKLFFGGLKPRRQIYPTRYTLNNNIKRNSTARWRF